MQIADAGGNRLEFESRGSGEPVLLIHGSVVADSYVPILAEPSLSRFRLVRYRRRGYGGSTHSLPPVSIADQAADCAALMRHLGIERAHIVGHSYGAAIALQLALDFPAAAHSLSLLEPALLFKIAGADKWSERMFPMTVKYQSGDKAGALEHFMGEIEGPAWRNAIDSVPGAWQMAIADADNFFQVEGLALLEWGFSAADARLLRQPILATVGADTAPAFHETHALALAWFPHAEPVEISGATHMLMMVKPRAVAEAISAFLSRHPLSRDSMPR